MRGNVLTLQVFNLLRELTAIDYQKGVNCNCFTLEKHFYESRQKRQCFIYLRVLRESRIKFAEDAKF